MNFENINFKNKRQMNNFDFVLKNIISKEITQNETLKNIIVDISNLNDLEIEKVCELLKDYKTIIINKNYKKICIM